MRPPGLELQILFVEVVPMLWPDYGRRIDIEEKKEIVHSINCEICNSVHVGETLRKMLTEGAGAQTASPDRTDSAASIHRACVHHRQQCPLVGKEGS